MRTTEDMTQKEIALHHLLWIEDQYITDKAPNNSYWYLEGQGMGKLTDKHFAHSECAAEIVACDCMDGVKIENISDEVVLIIGHILNLIFNYREAKIGSAWWHQFMQTGEQAAQFLAENGYCDDDGVHIICNSKSLEAMEIARA